MKDKLIQTYGFWGEHPDYPSCDWKYEVGSGDSRQGYWEWVTSSIEYDNE